MDSTKRKKKSFEFAEGHKRETRKSYQSFIENVGKSSITNKGTDNLSPLLLNIKSEDMADDGVRKSSRKPVPKKSFELVDVFEEKSTPLKNSAINKQKSNILAQYSPQEIEIFIKQEPDDDEQDLAPRKSNRVPVPKKSFDLIDPNLKRGMAVSQQDNMRPNVQVRTENKSKKTKTAEKANLVTSEAEGRSCTEKVKKTQHGKKSNKVKSPADALLEKQKKNQERREKSKLTLKLDFKAKKDKGSRKRKLAINTNHPSSNQHSDAFEMEGPIEKVAKVVEDNIDKSSLMEALQALKQPLENLPMGENEKAKLEKKSNLCESKKKVQKPKRKKQPSKIKKSAKDGSSIPQKAVQATGGKETGENNKDHTSSFSPEKGWDYSRSTTEISDGHVILKLGGLNSPSKVKKHKKKVKHGHHVDDTEFSNEESNKGSTKSHGSNEIKLTVPNESSNNQHKITSPSKNEVSGKKSAFPSENKEKKSKNHKKKRKLSQSKSEESSEKVAFDAKQDKEDELTVKKRKIYKKKKGEKILVRIQTEFWNKSGKLVKVESMEVKDGRANQPKDKTVVKQKNTQTVVTDPVVSARQIDTNLVKHSASDVGSFAVMQGIRGDQNTKLTNKKPCKLSSNQASSKPLSTKIVGNKSNLDTNAKKGANNPKKKKKERKTQTLTAYLLYCRKYRPKVVSEHPEIGMYVDFLLLK